METKKLPKIKASEIPDFDFARHLDSKERIAAYLDSILQDDDVDLLIASLGDIARARGMAYVSEKTNISRETLYRALKKNKKPRFETVSKGRSEIIAAVSRRGGFGCGARRKSLR